VAPGDSDKRFGRGRSNRSEKQKGYDDSKKGVVPKQLESAIAKAQQSGAGQRGAKIHFLTAMTAIMPPMDALDEDLLRWWKEVSQGYNNFKLDVANVHELRFEKDEECGVYTPCEDLDEEDQLKYAQKARDILAKISLEFIEGQCNNEQYHGVKWRTDGHEDLANLLGYYEVPSSNGRGVLSGSAQLNGQVARLGSTDNSGTFVLVQMYKGPTEVHAYHHTLRSGEEWSTKLASRTNCKALPFLSAPKGFTLSVKGKFVQLLYIYI